MLGVESNASLSSCFALDIFALYFDSHAVFIILSRSRNAFESFVITSVNKIGFWSRILYQLSFSPIVTPTTLNGLSVNFHDSIATFSRLSIYELVAERIVDISCEVSHFP